MVHLCMLFFTTSLMTDVGGGAAQREGGVGGGSRQCKLQDAGEQRGVGCSDQAAGSAALLTTQAAGHARAGMHFWRARKPDIWCCRTKFHIAHQMPLNSLYPAASGCLVLLCCCSWKLAADQIPHCSRISMRMYQTAS